MSRSFVCDVCDGCMPKTDIAREMKHVQGSNFRIRIRNQTVEICTPEQARLTRGTARRVSFLKRLGGTESKVLQKKAGEPKERKQKL